MVDILARVVADSIGPHSPRLFTIEARYPKFVHQEGLRHRTIYIEDALALDPDFSFSVSSSRAIPFNKMVAEALDPLARAAPVYWGAAQRGMSPSGPLDDTVADIFWPDVISAAGFATEGHSRDYITRRECAERLWHIGAITAANIARAMSDFTDVHKSVSNRMIEPYIHVNVLMTGTEPGWLNFFGLRLDKNADPTIRALAKACWAQWNESRPKELMPGAWHLPYADDEESLEEVEQYGYREGFYDHFDRQEFLLQLSVARCAHLSYQSFETGSRMTVEQCVGLYNRFRNSTPLHASPFEHQARLDHPVRLQDAPRVLVGDEELYLPSSRDYWRSDHAWQNPRLSGNLGPGWVQLRKLFAGEAVAPLPEAYL